MWSIYKAGVFTELYSLDQTDVQYRFFQIAETQDNRLTTSAVPYAAHAYPYTLLFKGSYNALTLSGLAARLVREVLRSRANLVLLPGYWRPEFWLQALAARLSGRQIGAFCDSTLRDRQQRPLKRLLKRLFLSWCDGVFCYGERSREYLLAMGVAPERIHIRRQSFHRPADYDAADVISQRVERRSSEPLFLYVGRLSPEKNVDVLLKAFAAYLARQPDARLRLVGEGPDGAMLKDLARALSITEAVTFAGPKGGADLFAEYLCATALILPSSSETWGLVVNEALAYGCPVIVSDNCGCVPELVAGADANTGTVVQPGDVEDLASAMEGAPMRFNDVEGTARRCLDRVAPFTAAASAAQIHQGCRAILSARGLV